MMKFRLYPFLLILVSFIHALILFQQYKIKSQPVAKFPSEQKKTFNVKILDHNEMLKHKAQIVQSDDSPDSRVKEGAYLSDKNRSFDRQTRARKIDTFKKVAKGKPQSGGKKAASKAMKLSDLGAMAGQRHPLETAAEMVRQGKSLGQAGIERSPTSSSASVSSTNDHIEGIPLGDTTYLNTVEYKYYGFYHRIRQRLEQFWGRSIQDKAAQLLKRGRRLPASDEHITSLQITLDEEGEIVAIKVMGTSGVKELDDAAIESFNDAGPFPNPPKDLIVDGKVTIEWGFVVQT